MSTILTTIKEIKKLTANNQHTESIMKLAGFLNQEVAQKKLSLIQQLQTLEGSLDSNLDAYRTRIRNNLLSIVLRDYGKDVFQLVRSSF